MSSFEIRRYQTRPGRRDEWVRYMHEVIIPFQTEHGMDVVGSFTDTDDPDGYIWIRRFDDDAHRAQAYAAVYESERWLTELKPAVLEFLLTEQSVVTTVLPTPESQLI